MGDLRRELTRAGETLARHRGAIDLLIGVRSSHTPRPVALLRALQEAFAQKFVGDPEYRLRCAQADFFPGDLRQRQQAALIPPTTPAPLERREEFRLQRIVRYIHAELGLTSPRKCNYLLLGETDRSELTRVAEVSRRGESLQTFARSRRPLRIVGGPRQVTELLQGRQYEFGPHSYVLAGPEICAADFRAGTAQALGIPLANVRPFYAAHALAVPHCSCEFGALHVPKVSEVVTVDGKLLFLSPYAGSALSLATNQPGRLDSGCPCGRKAAVLSWTPTS